MSDAHPTFSEIGEENVRQYLRRTMQFEEMMTCAPASYLKTPRQREEP